MAKQNIARVRQRLNKQSKAQFDAGKQPLETSTKNCDDEPERSFVMESKLYVPNGDIDLEWQPSINSVFKIMFSFRMAAALWSSISDCDEVYNYWEPLHLFLYDKGFQTWEYSPTYAIRSYMYILLHYLPGSIFRTIFSANKIAVFITIRCAIGLVLVLSELAFYKAICKRFGNGIARLYVVLTVFSAGMFTSSCAFLPSSFSMAINTFAIAAYMNEQWFLAIFCTAFSALVGWPFAALLGLPVVAHMLIVSPKRLLLPFMSYSLWAGTGIICAICFVDSYYYGKIVLAPLNIVLYNIFSSHGPNLYGIEKASFYVYNLLLNWNIAVPLAFLALPFSAYVFIRIRSSHKLNNRYPFEISLKYWQPFLPLLFIFLTLLLWLVIFFSQPHKEERFLFPIYPLIAVLAAVALDAIPRLGMFLFGGGSRRIWYGALVLVISVFIFLSLSRSIALYRNYSAPMKIYKGLNEHLSDPANLDDIARTENNGTVIKICVGKEWYRFPSSFFMPAKITDRKGKLWETELDFIKCEFSGLLPKYYASGVLPNISRLIPSEMNDLNLEEKSRYIPVSNCHYLVDLETPDVAEYEPNYTKQKETWKSVIRSPFLLASHSHPLYRAFYIPFTNDAGLKFGMYHLLKRAN
uniref:Mannosyltransferase n=1 Tax=Syphacia muris TaxID=451379 RepID=A0A0N5A809_9BILA